MLYDRNLIGREHSKKMVEDESESSYRSFIIRDAAIEDIDSIAQVAVNAWNFAYSTFLPPEFMAARADPSKRAHRMRENWRTDVHQIVAVSGDGVVLGFAFEHRPGSLEGYDAEIGALYVDPNASRSGVGRALVTEMVRRFRDLGFQSMAIHTLTENRIGCSFYEKLGGQEGPYTTWNEVPSRWFVWPDLNISFTE